MQDLFAAESGSAPVNAARSRLSCMHRYVDRVQVWPIDPAANPCPTVSCAPTRAPCGSEFLAGSAFDSHIQGSGRESRITRCGCFRLARSQRLAVCAFPELLMDTTRAAMSRGAQTLYHQPDLIPRFRQRRQSLIRAADCHIRRRRLGSDLRDPCRLAARSEANV